MTTSVVQFTSVAEWHRGGVCDMCVVLCVLLADEEIMGLLKKDTRHAAALMLDEHDLSLTMN